MKHLIRFFLGMVLGWLVLSVPANLMADVSLFVTLMAMLISLVPGLLILGWMHYVKDRSPEEKMVVVIASIVLRMGLAFAGAALARTFLEPIREAEYTFVTWALVFYLLAMAAEGFLLNQVDAKTESKTVSAP